MLLVNFECYSQEHLDSVLESEGEIVQNYFCIVDKDAEIIQVHDISPEHSTELTLSNREYRIINLSGMIETEEDKEDIALRALRQSEVAKMKSNYYSYLVSEEYLTNKKQERSIYDFDYVLQVSVGDLCKLFRLDPLERLEDKRLACCKCLRINTPDPQYAVYELTYNESISRFSDPENGIATGFGIFHLN